MRIEDLIWVLLGIMVYLFGAVVKATHTSVLQDILIPVDKRFMFDSKRSHSHHNIIPERIFDDEVSRECCPTRSRPITPLGGLSRDGSLLQLFRDSKTIQKFYETTCDRGVKGQPCNFVNGSEWISRCEQKHTYTYAIVKDFNVTEPYRIDYMKIKSGCSCIIKGRAQPPVISIEDELRNELLNEIEAGLLKK